METNKTTRIDRQSCVLQEFGPIVFIYILIYVYILTYLYICKNLRTYLTNSMPKAKNELAIFGWKMKTIKNIIN